MKNNIVLGLLFIVGIAFGQGSLTPTGAPTPTMKSLDQIDASLTAVATVASKVESRIDLATLAGDATTHHIISAPGSYYLSDNLDTSLAVGIDIQSSGVTLDLNGFEIRKVSSGGDGIHIAASANGVKISNGSVRSLTNGILSLSSNCTFKTLSVSRCVNGIVAGENARIDSCVVNYNTGYGIDAGNGAVLNNCDAYYNTTRGINTGDDCILNMCVAIATRSGSGIQTGSGCSLTKCSGCKNIGPGITTSSACTLNSCISTANEGAGFVTGSSTILSKCVASDNFGTTASMGFDLGSACIMRECIAKNNADYGINTQYGANLYDCSSIANNGSFGIVVGQKSHVVNCVSSENSSAFDGNSGGIFVAEGSYISECIISKNTNTVSTSSYSGIGIYCAGNKCVVTECTVNNNSGYGILNYSNSRLQRNQIIGNGSSGIYASGSENCIDENNLKGNALGIRVTQAGNFITRNTSSGNGASGSVSENYSLTGNQSRGTIYEYGTLILFGNPRGPWGNYSY
jgi:parallel beta-helix repeat protein